MKKDKFKIVLVIFIVISIVVLISSIVRSIRVGNCLNMPITEAYQNEFCKELINDMMGGN